VKRCVKCNVIAVPVASDLAAIPYCEVDLMITNSINSDNRVLYLQTKS
jgi:hypothetical protein